MLRLVGDTACRLAVAKLAALDLFEQAHDQHGSTLGGRAHAARARLAIPFGSDDYSFERGLKATPGKVEIFLLKLYWNVNAYGVYW